MGEKLEWTHWGHYWLHLTDDVENYFNEKTHDSATITKNNFLDFILLYLLNSFKHYITEKKLNSYTRYRNFNNIQ